MFFNLIPILEFVKHFIPNLELFFNIYAFYLPNKEFFIITFSIWNSKRGKTHAEI